MNYQVFARKYRPRTFDDVLGQEHVVRTLKNAITQDRLAHAYLFVGPRGTGKTSTARIFAKALNCPNGPKLDFDPDDPICIEIAEGRNLDVLEIDGASNNGVEQVRELRETVKFAPSTGAFRIIYIDEVHMLTTQAFNALLKTLEEPPPHVKFIFATTEPNKILPTILSRCQRFDLRPIPEKIIADHLVYIAENENVSLDPLAAHRIAQGSEGCMRDAQSMLDQLVAFCGEKIDESDVLDVFGLTPYATIVDITGAILNKQNADLLNLLHQENQQGRDLSKLLTDLINHLRNLLVCALDPASLEENLSPEILDSLKKQASQADSDRLLELIDHFAQTEARIKWSANKKLHLEVALIKATQLLSQVSLSDLILQIDQTLEGTTTTEPQETNPTPVKKQSSPLSAPPTPPVAPTEKKQEREIKKVEEEIAEPPPQKVYEDEALWNAVLSLATKQKPMLANWAKQGAFHEHTGDTIRIHFAKEHSIACDSLQRANTQSAFNEFATQLAQRPTVLEFSINESLAVSAPPPPPPPPLEEEPEKEEKIPASSIKEDPPAPQGKQEKERISEAINEEDFHNDPLIKEALQVFQAEIK